MSADASSLAKIAAAKSDSEKKAKLAANQEMSDQNTLLLERYRAHQKLKLEKEKTNQSEADKKALANALESRLENYPELKKFIEDKEKPDNVLNKSLMDYGCPKLERALFHAISYAIKTRNMNFVLQALDLGADPNAQISIQHYLIGPVIIVTPLYYSLIMHGNDDNNHSLNSKLQGQHVQFSNWFDSAQVRTDIISELIVRGANRQSWTHGTFRCSFLTPFCTVNATQ